MLSHRELVTGVLGVVKGCVIPQNGDLSFTGPKCKWLSTPLYAKTEIPHSRHTFFNLLVCKGQAVCGCLPTCSFPVMLIRCPGACVDRVNMVRSSRVVSSPHGAGTAILSLLIWACVVRHLPSPLPWTPDQIPKSDAFIPAYTRLLSRPFRYCP